MGLSCWLTTSTSGLSSRETAAAVSGLAARWDQLPADERPAVGAVLRHLAALVAERGRGPRVEVWTTLRDEVALGYEMKRGRVAVSLGGGVPAEPLVCVNIEDPLIVLDRVVAALRNAVSRLPDPGGAGGAGYRSGLVDEVIDTDTWISLDADTPLACAVEQDRAVVTIGSDTTGGGSLARIELVGATVVRRVIAFAERVRADAARSVADPAAYLTWSSEPEPPGVSKR